MKETRDNVKGLGQRGEGGFFFKTLKRGIREKIKIENRKQNFSPLVAKSYMIALRFSLVCALLFGEV